MKKILGTVLISAAAIITGYYLMTVPFHLFDSLSRIQMRILFIGEIMVYFAIFSAFFIIREARMQKKEKARALKEKHNKRIEERAAELEGINICSFNSAA